MIIDFHTHAFPDKLAAKAIEKLSFGPYVAHTDGTVGELRAKMKKSGIDRFVVCNIATNPKQMKNVNDFAIASKETEELIPLGSVHPMAENISEELARIKAAGLPGIKLHPDYMGFDIDDPVYDKIFDECSSLGLFVITHAGFDIYSPDHIHVTPDMILSILDRHPSLTLIAAHFGSNRMWDEVEEKLCGKNLYIDTSIASLEKMDPAQAKRIIEKHGDDRILFASDMPWCPVDENLRYIMELGLPAESLDKILSGNALRLLGM